MYHDNGISHEGWEIRIEMDSHQSCCGAMEMLGLDVERHGNINHLPEALKKLGKKIEKHVGASDYALLTCIAPDPTKVVDRSQCFVGGTNKDVNIYELCKTMRMRKAREVVNRNSGNTMVMFTKEIRFD